MLKKERLRENRITAKMKRRNLGEREEWEKKKRGKKKKDKI